MLPILIFSFASLVLRVHLRPHSYFANFATSICYFLFISVSSASYFLHLCIESFRNARIIDRSTLAYTIHRVVFQIFSYFVIERVKNLMLPIEQKVITQSCVGYLSTHSKMLAGVAICTLNIMFSVAELLLSLITRAVVPVNGCYCSRYMQQLGLNMYVCNKKDEKMKFDL